MFAREVFALLLREELISEALVEKIMGWRHTGFSVHSKVRAKTREEAERVGKYMIRPLLSLERLSLDEQEGKVTVRYFGLYANAHRGKVRKGQPDTHPFIIGEEECPRIPRRGWAEMIRRTTASTPSCPAGSSDGSRGVRGIFLRASAAVFSLYFFSPRSCEPSFYPCS